MNKHIFYLLFSSFFFFKNDFGNFSKFYQFSRINTSLLLAAEP